MKVFETPPEPAVKLYTISHLTLGQLKAICNGLEKEAARIGLNMMLASGEYPTAAEILSMRAAIINSLDESYLGSCFGRDSGRRP